MPRDSAQIRTLIVLILALLAPTLAMAQSGSLVVHVMDADGYLPGASVTLSSEVGFLKKTTIVTDAAGLARFPVLRAGSGYLVEVSFPGYGTVRKPNLMIHLNSTVNETVLMSREIVEEVESRARPEVVNLEKTETSSRFSNEFINDLPVPGRFYQHVLTMAPGVQDTDGDGNPNVHGSRERDFKTIVSGVSNVDPLTGTFMSNINPNSIEEIEVITAGASVEYSRAQGGFARIIQKQGSNEFEGVFDLLYRSHILDGDGAGQSSSSDLPKFDLYQPGFQLTGPIVRDRLWFRLSHELILKEDPVDILSGIETIREDSATHSDQVTWQVSPRNKLALLYQSDPIRIENLGVSSLIPASSTRISETNGETLSLTWTAPVSPRLLVETITAYQDQTLDLTPTNAGAANKCVQGLTDVTTQAFCEDLDTGMTSGAYPTIWHDHRQRFTLSSTATVYGGRLWGMNHQFKTGLLIENERYYRDLTQNPSLWKETVKWVGVDPLTGRVGLQKATRISGLFTQPRSSTDRATGTNWGLFFEDQVKLSGNLVVTAGARLDREMIDSDGMTPFDPSEQLETFFRLGENMAFFEKQQLFLDTFWVYEGIGDFIQNLSDQIGVPLRDSSSLTGFARFFRRPENIHITNDNLSPFLAVAWDPWGDGKTKVAFSARRYFDKIFLAIPLIELEPGSSTITFDVWNGILIPTSSTSPAVNIRTVDHELETPYQDEMVLSFEREISTETSLRITYVKRRYERQLQDYDINHLPGDYGRCVIPEFPGDPSVLPITDPDDPLYGMYPYGGDGILDDCVGTPYNRPPQIGLGGKQGTDDIEPGGSGDMASPDGIPDLYTQNLFWGDVRVVGNTGSAEYDGVVLELTRRMYRGWELQGSYTFSRAVGDGEDYNQLLGDDRSLLDAEWGHQSYDQRHVVKLNGTTITPWGFRFGTAITWQSGLPYSVLERITAYDPVAPLIATDFGYHTSQRIQYTTGQRNDQRNPSWWNVDIKVTREMALPRRSHLQISMEIFNLLNDGTYMVYNFSPGYRYGRQINGVNEATRRFGRQFQVGLKFMF